MKAFVYLVLDRGAEPNRWYIGYKVGDYFGLRDKYRTSSKIVRPMMLTRPQDFNMFLIACGTQAEMKELEADLQCSVDAAGNSLYYNAHNSGSKFFNSLKGDANPSKRDEVRNKISTSLAGKKKPWAADFNRRTKTGIAMSADHVRKRTESQKKWYGSPEGLKRREELSAHFKTVVRSSEWRRKISDALKGKQHSDEHRRNNGLSQKRYFETPAGIEQKRRLAARNRSRARGANECVAP